MIISSRFVKQSAMFVCSHTLWISNFGERQVFQTLEPGVSEPLPRPPGSDFVRLRLERVCARTCVPRRVRARASMCGQACVRACVYMWPGVYMCPGVCVRVRVHVSRCVHVRASMCGQACAWSRACARAQEYVWPDMCVCPGVCVRARVRVARRVPGHVCLCAHARPVVHTYTLKPH